jgi:hypothetical protein
MALQTKVQSEEARQHILDSDLVINCLDNNNARMELQVLAARYLKPMLDLGVGIRLKKGTKTVREMGGQSILYYPGGPCLLCQGFDVASVMSEEMEQVHRATGYIEGTGDSPASVVTLNSVVAGLGMQVVLNYVTGFAEPPVYLRYDFLRNETSHFNFIRRQDCPVCGENGIEGKGDLPEAADNSSNRFFQRGRTGLPGSGPEIERIKDTKEAPVTGGP